MFFVYMRPPEVEEAQFAKTRSIPADATPTRQVIAGGTYLDSFLEVELSASSAFTSKLPCCVGRAEAYDGQSFLLHSEVPWEWLDGDCVMRNDSNQPVFLKRMLP